MANAVEVLKELKGLTATRENHLLDLSPISSPPES